MVSQSQNHYQNSAPHSQNQANQYHGSANQYPPPQNQYAHQPSNPQYSQQQYPPNYQQQYPPNYQQQYTPDPQYHQPPSHQGYQHPSQNQETNPGGHEMQVRSKISHIMNHDLFGCCETPCLCLGIMLCGPFCAAFNQNKFDSCGWTCLTCMIFPCCGTRNRTEVKKAVGVYDPNTDSICENCLIHTFCLVCALVQENRAVSLAEQHRLLVMLDPERQHLNAGVPTGPSMV